MELKDFVKNTLIEITNGIKEAQEATKENGAIVSPNMYGSGSKNIDYCFHNKQIVEFNVAVTATDEANVGAGIHVASLFKAGGDVKEINSSISTICFKVPIVFPTAN